jgi:hypothetical protein
MSTTEIGTKLEAGAACPGPRGLPARKRRRWRWGLVLVFVLVLVYFRAAVLRAVALPLIVEAETNEADYLVVLDGDYGFDRAAQLVHDGSARQILLYRMRPLRLERMHILPSSEALARQQLRLRGVPDDRMTALSGEVFTEWDMARELGAWLAHHPGVRVNLQCAQFGSSRKRYILNSVLGSEEFSRVAFLSLPHRWYDESNWWQGKRGWLGLVEAYLRLGYVTLHGEDRHEWREWNADEYERALP